MSDKAHSEDSSYNLSGDNAPGKLDHLDFELDPVLRETEYRKSTREAIFFVILIPVIVCIVAFAIANFSRMIGGPLCEAGTANWLCTRSAQILFCLVPGAISFLGLLGASFMTYRKWQGHNRWQPWLAIVWVLIPFTLSWITGTGVLAMQGHV